MIGTFLLKDIKCCVIEKQHFLREAIASLINNFGRIKEVHSISCGAQMHEVITSCKPDIILLSVFTSEIDVINVTETILRFYPNIKILMLAMNEDIEIIARLLRMGVHGYVSKSANVNMVEKAIYQIADRGHFYADEFNENNNDEVLLGKNTIETKIQNHRLTKREVEIVKLICNDLNNNEIARQLKISTKTLRIHKQNIFKKTETRSMLSLFHFAQRARLFI